MPLETVICAKCGAQFLAKPSKTRKYCSAKCYGNERQRGDRAAAFWALVEKTDDCWIWMGRLSPKGYGLFCFDAAGDVIASREAWKLTHGTLGVSHCVLHRCDNPRCVRPEHLFIGDKRDNARDMVAKRRHMNNRKTHCKRGHEFTQENTMVMPNGYRNCRTCVNERRKALYQQRRKPSTHHASTQPRGPHGHFV